MNAQTPLIRAKFSGWTDNESLIEFYDVEVYRLFYNPTKQLLAMPPEPEKAKESIKPIDNFNYQYHLQAGAAGAGVYAVVLTVHDRAGNRNRARELLFYDPASTIVVRADKPLYVTQANKNVDYGWISHLPNERKGEQVKLNVAWLGRYTNSRHVEKNWLDQVEEWGHANGIDDDIQYSGNRTIHPVDHKDGIVGYNLAYVVDDRGGDGIDEEAFTPINETWLTDDARKSELEQRKWLNVDPRKSEHVLRLDSLNDSNTVVVWMRAFDATGSSKDDRMLVHVDTSAPVSAVDAVLRENQPDQFAST